MMECQELRHEAGEWRLRRLPADRQRELETHLGGCPDCQHWVRDEEALRRLLLERLPRHAAPPRLAGQIREAASPRKSWWWAPATAAVATAMLMALVLLPALPQPTPPDPLERIIQAAVLEHTRGLLLGDLRSVARPAVLRHLMKRTRIGLSGTFMGDEEIRLQGAEPVLVEGQRGLEWGLALFYTDPEGHVVTYVVIPGEGLTVPQRDRVQIDSFRPMLVRTDDLSVFVWKQRGLACFLIADLGSEWLGEYFLKVRSSMEPYPLQE